MRGVEVDADGIATRPGVDGGRHAAEGFTQNHVRATVKNADHLPISLNRHACYRFRCRNLEKFDSQLAGQFTTAGGEALLKFGVKVVKNSHRVALPSVALGRLTP